jgi:hypothetical protein
MSSTDSRPSSSLLEGGGEQKVCRPFFVNILLLNKDEVVAKKVEQKTGTGFFGKAAAFAANKLVTDEKVTAGLADGLIAGVTKATSELGITADMEIKFQQGPFVVPLQLILSAKGEEFASNFTTLLTTVEALGLKDSVAQKIDEKIYGAINEGMMGKFKLLIPQKMAEQGVIVDVQVVSAEEEAEVFFDILQTVNTMSSTTPSRTVSKA